MASPSCSRLPIGMAKRIRALPTHTSRTSPTVTAQRMGMAKMVDHPSRPRREDDLWKVVRLPDDVLKSIMGTKEEWSLKSQTEKRKATERRNEERKSRWLAMSTREQADLLDKYNPSNKQQVEASQKAFQAQRKELDAIKAETHEKLHLETERQKNNQPDLPPGYEHISKLDARTRALLFNMTLPPNVQSIYLQPLRRVAEHGIPVCDLQLRSFSVRNLEFFADFAMRAAYYIGMPAKGPVPLPQITERWTVPRSPFIHKKSQENFERKTYRRLIQIQDADPEVVQCWLGYLEKRSYHGIGMKANVWEREELDVPGRMDERAGVMDAAAESMWANFGVRKNALKNLDKLMSSEAFSSLPQPMEALRREPIEIQRKEAPRVV